MCSWAQNLDVLQYFNNLSTSAKVVVDIVIKKMQWFSISFFIYHFTKLYLMYTIMYKSLLSLPSLFKASKFRENPFKEK